MRASSAQARILITNFHAFQPREKSTPATHESILGQGKPGPFTESPDEMVRRVCRELGQQKEIIVINDEAHHCYRRKPDGRAEKLTRRRARRRPRNANEEARLWISGLEAVKARSASRPIYDLSATPFFLKAPATPKVRCFRGWCPTSR